MIRRTLSVLWAPTLSSTMMSPGFSLRRRTRSRKVSKTLASVAPSTVIMARTGSVRALAAWRAGVLPSHGDVAARLVDEDEPARVEALRKLDETAPEGLYPGLALLYGREGLSFSRVRQLQQDSVHRRPADGATRPPVERPRDLLVGEVGLLCDDRTHDVVPAGRDARRVTASSRPRRTRAPVSRFNRFQRRTVASPTLNSAAASSSVIPARSNAATTRSRRSTEYAHPIATSRASPGAADQRRSITSTRQRCQSGDARDRLAFPSHLLGDQVAKYRRGVASIT